MNGNTQDFEAIPLLDNCQDDELMHAAVRKAAAAACAGTMSNEERRRTTGQIVDDLAQRHPLVVTSGEERLQACQEIDAMIDESSRYLASMQAKYRIDMPDNIAIAMAMPDMERTGRNLGGVVLKDAAVRNVCTNIAWRIARIQAYSSGGARLDGGHEVDRCRGIVSTWLSKHGKTVTPIALEEASHWLAQQVVKKANVLVRNEVAAIYGQLGTIPDPDFGEYDSRLLTARAKLLRDYDKFNTADTERNPKWGEPPLESASQPEPQGQTVQTDREELPARTVVGTSGKTGRESTEIQPDPKALRRDTGMKATLRHRLKTARQNLMDAHRQPPREHSTETRRNRGH
ncbi:hypothetical protein [Bifidobacterium pseudolongum]|uniref:hypothetical protein n=1 Tax=Bifidobacterium pseudolongum TaxID=1694 RepID=UPI00101EE3BF|nr:hypothetical protein [Bifidobacterium pseudolongum]RYQ65490.1 hypothetical protein PG2103B_1714 [Bifidobacterium pseudolongum subsp. globosum]